MKTLIITGGNINEKFLKEYLSQNQFEKIIAVDKGLEILKKMDIKPDYIIGDFDSVNSETLKQYENTNIHIEYLKPEKDFTDTHMAMKMAIKIGSNSITILGATGTRIDHSLANIHILKEALEQNVYVELIDEHNKIILLNKNTEIELNEKYKYISLIPLTNQVKGVTLKGFKYELNNAELKIGESIGISNEQIEKRANIKIKEGIIILVFSKD